MNASRNLGCIWLCLSLVLLVATVAADESRPVRGLYLEPGKTGADYRNVALNPTDTTNREPVNFPHATSNS